MSHVLHAQAEAHVAGAESEWVGYQALKRSCSGYSSNLPDERKTILWIIHGDYKLDTLVFYETKQVICCVELCVR